MSTPPLRIVIAHGSDSTLQEIHEGLDERSSVIATCGTTAELHSAVRQDRPDLIVCGVTFPDGDGLEACIEIGRERPMPAVIVTALRSMSLVNKAMEDHVMAYLIEPVRPEDLQAAVIVAWSRYQQLEALEEEVGDLRNALQQRKLIERAKGVLMAAEGLTEAEAFGKIRSMSQDRRSPMADIAQEIVDETTEEIENV